MIRRWATGPVTGSCQVTLGASMGMRFQGAGRKPIFVPADQLSIADLEFVELYLPTITGKVRPGQSISAAPAAQRASQDAPAQGGGEGCGNIGLIVWLRK